MAPTGGLTGWLAGMGAVRALGPVVAQLSTPVPIDPWLAVLAVEQA